MTSDVDRAEYIRMLEEKLTVAQNARDSALDHEHTTSCGHKWTMRHTACPECFVALRQRVAEQQELLDAKWGHEITGAIVADEVVSLRQRVEELERESALRDIDCGCNARVVEQQQRAEAAEAKLAEAQALTLGYNGELGRCAVELAAAKAEVARLRAQAMAAPIDPKAWWDLSDRHAKAEAEVERLRAALQEISLLDWHGASTEAGKMARAALRGGGPIWAQDKAREWDATRVSGPALFARDIDSLAALLAEVASETRRKTLDEPAEPSSERDAAVILAESLGYNVVKFPMVTQIMRQHICGERARALAEVRRVVIERRNTALDNSKKLARYQGEEQEARCRELAALYCDEILSCLDKL